MLYSRAASAASSKMREAVIQRGVLRRMLAIGSLSVLPRHNECTEPGACFCNCIGDFAAAA